MRSARCIGYAVVALLAAALAIWTGIFYVSRRVEEFYYVAYVKGEFLPAGLEKSGKWPQSLTEVGQDIQTRYFGRGLKRSGELLMRVQQRGRPVLTIRFAGPTDLKGTIQFKWLMGGTYRFEAIAHKRSKPVPRGSPDAVGAPAA